MPDTLTHLIGGETPGGDASGESINPSNLDDIVARYPKGGAAEVDQGWARVKIWSIVPRRKAC